VVARVSPPRLRSRRQVAKRAGIPHFSSNDLRRTCATWLVKRGVSFNLTAKVMGQASTFMLTKVYGQLDSDDVGRLINERLATPDARRVGAH
jgi:integrase